MYVGIAPPSKGQNTGSCVNLATYLNKEKIQKNFFFTQEREYIPINEVIQQIDNNKNRLCSKEDKFYLIDICPSKEELNHIVGRKVDSFEQLTSIEQQKLISSLKGYTNDVMNEYAKGFGRKNVTSNKDLLYFAKVEVNRPYKYTDEKVRNGQAKTGELKEGLNVHVHVIVSRKSKDGNTKLSPCYARSKGNEWNLNGRGNVRRGLSHVDFKINSSNVFEERFNYKMNQTEKFAIKEDVKTETLSMVDNKDLKEILTEHQFTSVGHVSRLMEQKGYSCDFRYGRITFAKEGIPKQVFRQKDFHFFKTEYLPNDVLQSIAERLDGYAVSNFVKGTESQFTDQTQQITIERNTFYPKTKEKKPLTYFIVYDKTTKSSIPLGRVKNYAYDNKIDIYGMQFLGSVKNKDIRAGLYHATSYKMFSAELKSRGYEITLDGKDFIFTKNGISERMSGESVRGGIYGYGICPTELKNYSSFDRSMGMFKGQIASSAKNVLRENFSTELSMYQGLKDSYNIASTLSNLSSLSNPYTAAVKVVSKTLKLALRIGEV